MATVWIGWAVVIHWLACIWLLMPLLQSSWRDESDVNKALTHRIVGLNDTSCDACICSSDKNSDVCISPCLTRCETETIATLRGVPLVEIEHGQSWLCRAVGKGWLPSSFATQPLTMWVYSLAKVCRAYTQGWAQDDDDLAGFHPFLSQTSYHHPQNTLKNRRCLVALDPWVPLALRNPSSWCSTGSSCESPSLYCKATSCAC